MLDRVTSMQVFVRVAALGSFSAAARALDLSQTMVTKHVVALEERLGIKLLHRSTRKLVLTEGVRMDGRDVNTIRPISVEVGLLPRAHGSALFTRGDTQALTVATLGPSSDVQRIDTIGPEESKSYLHHYNMPPYSTGENKMMRGPGRREIGHGALAERALIPVLPSHDFAEDDAHAVEDDEDDAGDHRGPEEATLVFPEFAFDQPVEGFHA